ncbi:ribonuclease HII [Pigmentiphaga soli]|uniref:Ribonuclease HII n=1 Tax=Pigmentiphaga soli TaxID=1007095 RepID=A0ABP8HE46_9BURK
MAGRGGRAPRRGADDIEMDGAPERGWIQTDFGWAELDLASLETTAVLVRAGVDEAGRGPLAGPVYAAAVVLDPDRPILGLADSKALEAEERDALAVLIRARAHAWAVASASVQEIDSLNILNATMLAMRRAVDALNVAIDLAEIDGNRAPALRCRVRTVIGGDAQVPAISAASILAKTARDAELVRLHELYPAYGFHQHKGYGTPQHLSALFEHGPCPEHRRSFAPVRDALDR